MNSLSENAMSPRPALPLRLEYVLLGLIRRQATHGYDLLQRWNDANNIGIVWQVKPGALYAALEKLEKMDHIRASVVPGNSSPQRKEFSITVSGEQAFLIWMQSPILAARIIRQDFLSRLFFFEDVDPVVVGNLIDQQTVTCQGWMKSLNKQHEACEGFEKQVLAFRLYQVRGILAWLQELSAGLKLTSSEELE
jgi:DNA-binding PadR family transcriptional regulator